MAHMAKYGTEGEANVFVCNIFVCQHLRKLMVPMKKWFLKDLDQL